MATFAEQFEQLEHMLTKVSQVQEQGQAQLEQALKRVEDLVPSAGQAIAQTLEASARQAADLQVQELQKVVGRVTKASHEAVSEAASAVQAFRASMSQEVEKPLAALKASTEGAERACAALQGLTDQGLAGQQALEGIQERLAQVSKAVANHEMDLRQAVLKAEVEAMKELRELGKRARGLLPKYLFWAREGVSWGLFCCVLTAAIWAIFFVVQGSLEGSRGRKIREEVVAGLNRHMVMRGMAYNLVPLVGGGTQVQGHVLEAPLVVMGDGSLRQMTRNPGGGWTWEGRTIEADQVPLAKAWDTSTGELVKQSVVE
ncbi:hypothetical protein [Holophaga foetida]|uniref:hypothetical protein n=1 Tax=Holophaga foetida TaxID=35839 RepID=UPI00024742AE|nr:hypothetical protein [Holophaga foetida]